MENLSHPSLRLSEDMGLPAMGSVPYRWGGRRNAFGRHTGEAPARRGGTVESRDSRELLLQSAGRLPARRQLVREGEVLVEGGEGELLVRGECPGWSGLARANLGPAHGQGE